MKSERCLSPDQASPPSVSHLLLSDEWKQSRTLEEEEELGSGVMQFKFDKHFFKAALEGEEADS